MSKENTVKLSRFSKIIYLLGAFSLLLYVLFSLHAGFADWFNTSVSPILRRTLAYLTNWIPFSIAELLLILIPFWVVLLIVIAKRKYCDSWRHTGVFLAKLGSGVALIWVLFVWGFAAGYYATPLDQKLEIDRTNVKTEELFGTAEILAEELARLEKELLYYPNGSSVMPYSYREMNEKLLRAYDAAEGKYSFLQSFTSYIKPVMLSEPMSYTHITGVYTFFTGEANLNVNFPDYTLPFTAAHEMAHQRGIAREDEANFVAFLVCLESDDPYIRYSAVLNVYEYFTSAMSSTDRTRYKEVYTRLPEGIKEEMKAYSRFFDRYRENVAASVSQATNNTYLQLQGASSGTKSYSMVVELTVAFYRPSLPTVTTDASDAYTGE